VQLIGCTNPRTELSLFGINKGNLAEFLLDLDYYLYLSHLVYAKFNPNLLMIYRIH